MKNLKLTTTIVLISLAAFSCTHKKEKEVAAAPTMPIDSRMQNMDGVTVIGTVKKFLINPNGDIDGLLLDDKTQVTFSPGHSKHIQESIFLNDKIEVVGTREVGSVVSAAAITNRKTNKAVNMDEELVNKVPANIKEMSVQGRIEEQLFGPAGDLNGVILKDGTIVHINTNLVEDANVNVNLGQRIKVKGTGIKNKYGKAVMAESIKN